MKYEHMILESDIDYEDDIGYTALFYACTDAVKTKVLIEAGVNVNHQNKFGEIALFYSRDPEKIKVLLEAGADINHADSIGRTVLFYADYKTAKLLIDNGANVSHQDKNGETALFYIRDPEKIKVLLEAGADINHADNIGKTVLFYAGYQTSKMLIGNGANVNHQDKNGETALDSAIFCESNEKIKLLMCISSDLICRYSEARHHHNLQASMSRLYR